MRELKRYDTFKDLGEWYNNKYTEMGDGWDCPEDVAEDYIRFAEIDKAHHDDNLLDVGCGAGHFLKVASKYLLCMGVDLSSVAIEKAKQRVKHCIFDVSSIEEMPSFYRYSYITSIGSLEHTLDIPKALDKIYSLLEDDGSFFALVPNDKWLHMDQPNETTYSNDEWERLFTYGGFKVIKFEERGDLSLFLLKKI